MSLTPNYGFNIPTGSDAVNLLTQNYPNFTSLDSILKTIELTGITTATVSKVGTVFQLVRTNSALNVIRFVATGNYVAGDTFTVDGVAVTATSVQGTSLQTGAFVINQSVVCILNQNVLTVLVGGSGSNDAADIDYDNTGSGLTATNVQDAIDEVKADIPSIPATYDADDIVYDNTTSGLTATDVQAAIDELKNLIVRQYVVTGLTLQNCVINDGGYYIDNGFVYVDITVTATTNLPSGSGMVLGFPTATGGPGADVTGVYNDLRLHNNSSNVTALTSGALIVGGTTRRFIGSYQMV